MNAALHKLFALVGSLGLVAPHDGHETKLLLSHKKPLGYLTITDCPEQLMSPTSIRNTNDVLRLDVAVAEGKLRKCTATIPPSVDYPYTGVAHFYCQPGLEASMHALCGFHEAFWQGLSPPTPSEPIGIMLGYTEADVDLFDYGGYGNLSWGLKSLMSYTHTLRKAARIASMQPIGL